MTTIVPTGSLLGELSIDDVLINYDGPKLFSCTNHLGFAYLALSVEESDDGAVETFLYAPTDPATIRKVAHGLLPLRDVFSEPTEPHVWVAVIDYVHGTCAVNALLASDIKNDWLPAPRAVLPSKQSALTVEDDYESRLERTYGSEGAMAMTLSLDGPLPSAGSNARLECRVGLSVLGQPVWGDSLRAHDGIQVDVAAFCRFFARNWAHLALEEELPIGITIGNLEHVRRSFQSTRASLPAAARRYREEALEGFYATHDLARSVSSTAVPSVVIAKQGLRGWLLQEDSVQGLPLSAILSPIEELVSDLATVLKEAGDESDDIVSEWNNRWDRSGTELVALATRRTVHDVEVLGERSSALAAAISGDSQALTRSEVVAAARMTRGLDLPQTVEILEEIGRLPAADMSKIATLSKSVCAAMVNSTYPYDEGLDAARALRQELSMRPEDPVNPHFILEESLGVTIYEVSIDGARSLDAFAAWGPNFGPAVVINARGLHNKGNGRNATLAHELGHLMMDRLGALPVADVLLGSQRNDIEARARAFAAEFLLPQHVAKAAFANWTGSIEGIVRRLSTKFHVSKSVAAWNLHNSGAMLTEEERLQLRAIAGLSASEASPAIEPQ